jgi:hypothetical protein
MSYFKQFIYVEESSASLHSPASSLEEATNLPGVVTVRDSKNPDGPSCSYQLPCGEPSRVASSRLTCRAASATTSVRRGRIRDVTAQSAPERDPDDPVEILRILPSQLHEQFLAEYGAAVTGARRPEHYHELHHLLRLWRLRAAAYSDPGYESRLRAMQDAARTGRRGGTPIEEVVPDWAERVAAARRRAGE